MYPTRDRSNIFDKLTIQLLQRISMWTKDVAKLSDTTIKRRLDLLKERVLLNKFQLINLLRNQNVLLTESVLRAEKRERAAIDVDEAVLKDSSFKTPVKRKATEERYKRLDKKALVEKGLLPSCTKTVDTIKQAKKKESPIHHQPSTSTGPRSQAPQDWLS